jgi:hypothetical protein
MKTHEVENLQAAITDKGVSLKNLGVDEYMKTLRVTKKVSAFLDERTNLIQELVKEYNKEYQEKIKSPEFQALAKKKADELTPEQVEFLSIQPPVQQAQVGTLSGPFDFVDKVERINKQTLDFKKDELNFITDSKIFKAVVEGASVANQAVLYEYLFKQSK